MVKIYPRDIIGIIVVLFGMILIAKGINQVVSGIVIMVVTWYFTQRFNGNGVPGKDLHERVRKVEEGLNIKIPQHHHIYRPDKKKVEKEFEKTKQLLEAQSSVPSSDLS